MVKVREDMTGWNMWERGIPDSKLTVVQQVEDHITSSGHRYSQWLCKCQCGNKIIVRGAYLKTGNTKSCGCFKLEYSKKHIKELHKLQIRHNESRTRLHRIWLGMKDRCNNPNNPRYSDYGGRGICVCDNWNCSYESFRDWSLLNGYEQHLSIDRIDVDGNYEPQNCKWSTNKEQQNNMRTNKLLTYKGETHSISEWSEITGINKSTLSKRINRSGWSVEKALTTIIK